MSASRTSIFLALLIFLGIAVRAAGLSTHFSHIDDHGVARTILNYKNGIEPLPPATTLKDKIKNEFRKWTCVPRHWTYAPLQYLMTYAMVWPEQTYRQNLFWGRLPSFLAAVGAFALFLLFYWKYERFTTSSVFLAAALFALSWENIIYAQQMQSYAIGVTAATAILVMLMYVARREKISWLETGVLISTLGVLSYAQYQVLFLVPAFFIALFWAKTSIKKLAASAVFYGVLITPLYLLFLRQQKAQAGVNWNAGPHNEFLFDGFFSAVPFFIQNTFITVTRMIAFVPEEHILFLPISLFFFALLVFGAVRFCRPQERKKKLLGVFFLVTALTWAGLIVMHKLTLGPTRHQLILLPFLLVLIAEGWNGLAHRLQPSLRPFATPGLVSIIVLLFAISFPSIYASRRDRFDEKQLEELFRTYAVGSVISTDYSWQLGLMEGIWRRINYFESETMVYPYHEEIVDPFQTIAFISQRAPQTPEVFELAKFKLNLYQNLNGRPGKTLNASLKDYQQVYSKEISSDVEVEFSKLTKNGTNGFYLTILQRRT